MTCDHGMMLMSDHDDAYVDATLMVNMQANTRSVTFIILRFLLINLIYLAGSCTYYFYIFIVR